VANIEKNIAMFNNVGCRVVVVSFGTAKGGEGWLNATGCQLDMFLDSERNLYQAVGLHRSVVKVWNISVINYYAQQIASGRELPSAVQGVEDDPLQMGGDFTINCSSNILVMSYPSSKSTDRPSIEYILDKIK